VKYKITSELVAGDSKIRYALEIKGKFIIAIKELDEKALSTESGARVWIFERPFIYDLLSIS